jgi:hemerythrin
MPLIEWDDSYRVGFEEIDAQHQRWVQMINNLDNALSRGDLDQLKRVKHESLDSMIDYARFHFTFEEQFMAKMRYPALEAHKAAHAQLIKTLLQIQADIRRGYQPLNTQLMSIMMHWLTEHILNVDKQYGYYGAKNKAAV